MCSRFVVGAGIAEGHSAASQQPHPSFFRHPSIGVSGTLSSPYTRDALLHGGQGSGSATRYANSNHGTRRARVKNAQL